MLLGSFKDIEDTEAVELVEFGIARFRQGNRDEKVRIDEVIPLLAFSRHFLKAAWNQEELLIEPLRGDQPSCRGFSFENLVAYLLMQAFGSPIQLSSVFEFISDYEFAHSTAQAMAIRQDGDSYSSIPFDAYSDKRTAFRMGYKAKDKDDFLSWLRDPCGIPLCFTPHTNDFDLIILLELDSKTHVALIVCSSDGFVVCCIIFLYLHQLTPS